jgi:hypothetical protein
MAMSTESSGSAAPPSAAASGSEGAPAWVVPLYVGGLVVVYMGERVLSAFDSGRLVVTGAGVVAVLAATAARFVPTWQTSGERGRIEKLLGILSALGVLALCLYAASTDWGFGKLGLLTAPDDKREKVHTLLTILWVTLVGVSVVPTLFAEAALYPMRNAERLESRRVRAAAAAGLTLAFAALYCALFVYSAAGSEVKVDFSYFKTSEPSASTKRLVEGLNEPIRVIGFFPEVNPVRNEVQAYLQKLAAGAKNLKIEMHDRYLVPKLTKEMKIFQDGVILIQKGEAKRTLNVGTELKDAQKNLKTLDRDFQERVYKLLRERRTIYLTVGHGEINDEKTNKQETGRSAQILKLLLGKQNYTLKDLGLGQGLATEVPNDADVVMVLGPTAPFSPEEISSLDRYGKRGGKLFVALDPDAVSAEEVDTVDAETARRAAAGLAPAGSSRPVESGANKPVPSASAKAGNDKPKPSASAKPGDDKKGEPLKQVEVRTPPPPPELGAGTEGSLVALAALAGVKFSGAILANDKDFARRRYNDSDHTLLVTNRFSSHASVSTLSRNSSRAAVLVAGAGAVEKLPGTAAKVDIAVRAPTSTFGDLNKNYRFDDGSEKRESYGLAAAITLPVEGVRRPEPEPKKDDKQKDKDIPIVAPPNEMRAFVLADADAISDLAMSNFMTNQLLVVDATRWLGGEESFAGEVNTEEDVKIEHTQKKDLVWFYSTIFGAPALVLGLGLTYSRKSRRPRGGKK